MERSPLPTTRACRRLPLTGTGNSPATDTLAPLALTFAAQQIGTISATQQVLLTNSGDVALTLVSANISSGPFTAVNGCGASLTAHSTCAINVAFVPTTTGAANGVLTATDQFRSQTVSLSGTGVAPAGDVTDADSGAGIWSDWQWDLRLRNADA